MSNECCCGGVKLIYSCSGASDVGQVSDNAARKLSKDGFGKMTCLAAAGAHLSGFVESAKGADENITIDGCSAACSRKILEHIGATPKSYIITNMGFEKGKTKVSGRTIRKVCGVIQGALSSETLNEAINVVRNPGCSCSSLPADALFRKEDNSENKK